MEGAISQAPVIYQLNANDLKEVVAGIYREEREKILREQSDRMERATISRKEACQMLDVSMSTLWKWAKCGYLTPVKVGTKVLYRRRDIDSMLQKQMEGGAL